MAPPELSPIQTYALFDILSHHEAYAEVQALKDPRTVANFGVPLEPDDPQNSSSPLIQILLRNFILVLPGLRDVPSAFWRQNIKGLATALDDAVLSESYDKGSIGIRKTLSTAISSMIEYVSRGCLGGYARHEDRKVRNYETSNPDDVINAWDEFLQQIIYGDMLDKMFNKAAETDKLSDHESLVQAAHEYALVMIVSQVLSSDTSELRKRAKAIEHDKESPSKEHLAALKDYGEKSMQEKQSIRDFSETEPESMALAVLSATPHLGELNNTQQKLALEYLAIQLAIRDREQLIKVLCHSSPDLVTTSIRAVIPAYDPVIRALHSAVDLSSGVSDLEAFLNDLIKVSTVDAKAKGGEVHTPSVEDYCRLLQKHQGSSHRFIHQALKNSKDLFELYHKYAAHAAEQYKRKPSNDISIAAAGDFTPHLNSLISSTPEASRAKIFAEIDAHASYLSKLSESSSASMKSIILNLNSSDHDKDDSRKSGTISGPGIYLARWQSLMDQTSITPATAGGQVRRGGSLSVQDATRVDIDGQKKGGSGRIGVDHRDGTSGGLDPPDVSETIKALGDGFKKLLRDVSQRVGEK